jgi:hypothetical protein
VSARKAQHRSPCRKAGRVAARKTKRVLAFRLVVEGQEMRVRYTPCSFGDDYGQFEFNSPHRPARRIAISETGYCCHFAPTEEIAKAKSPQDYARALVLAALDAQSPGRRALTQRGQLSLF